MLLRRYFDFFTGTGGSAIAFGIDTTTQVTEDNEPAAPARPSSTAPAARKNSIDLMTRPEMKYALTQMYMKKAPSKLKGNPNFVEALLTSFQEHHGKFL